MRKWHIEMLLLVALATPAHADLMAIGGPSAITDVNTSGTTAIPYVDGFPDCLYYRQNCEQRTNNTPSSYYTTTLLETVPQPGEPSTLPNFTGMQALAAAQTSLQQQTTQLNQAIVTMSQMAQSFQVAQVTQAAQAAQTVAAGAAAQTAATTTTAQPNPPIQDNGQLPIVPASLQPTSTPVTEPIPPTIIDTPSAPINPAPNLPVISTPSVPGPLVGGGISGLIALCLGCVALLRAHIFNFVVFDPR